MKHCGINAIIGCCFLAATGVAAAHPVLEFVEHTETKQRQNVAAPPVVQDVPLRVTLGRDYTVMDANGTRTIMDLKQRRVYSLKLAEKTYSEGSLYASLGFAAMELQNRVRLGAILDAAKVDETMKPALAEHLFSLLVPNQGTVIDSARQDGTTYFRWQGKDLLWASDKAQALPPGYMPHYWRWLRYRLGGHPKIYDALQARDAVPEAIQLTRLDVAEKVVTLRLVRVTNGPDASYSLAGFTRGVTEREPMALLASLPADPGAKLQGIAGAALAARNAAAAQDQMLDAMLAYLAYSNTTGKADAEWSLAVRPRMAADPDLRALAASLTAANAEQAKKAIDTLASIRGKTSSPYAYMLDLFAANHQVTLRNAPEAQKQFMSALQKNPYLTGAWLDLGKLYYGTFRTEEAWACFDAARALNPSHPSGREITELERRMAADHPEFF